MLILANLRLWLLYLALVVGFVVNWLLKLAKALLLLILWHHIVECTQLTGEGGASVACTGLCVTLGGMWTTGEEGVDVHNVLEEAPLCLQLAGSIEVRLSALRHGSLGSNFSAQLQEIGRGNTQAMAITVVLRL